MELTNVIAAIVILAIVGGALAYIIREKKRGAKCIGCPYSNSCKGGCKTHSQDK